jgi:hypothetical protein
MERYLPEKIQNQAREEKATQEKHKQGEPQDLTPVSIQGMQTPLSVFDDDRENGINLHRTAAVAEHPDGDSPENKYEQAIHGEKTHLFHQPRSPFDLLKSPSGTVSGSDILTQKIISVLSLHIP